MCACASAVRATRRVVGPDRFTPVRAGSWPADALRDGRPDAGAGPDTNCALLAHVPRAPRRGCPRLAVARLPRARHTSGATRQADRCRGRPRTQHQPCVRQPQRRVHARSQQWDISCRPAPALRGGRAGWGLSAGAGKQPPSAQQRRGRRRRGCQRLRVGRRGWRMAAEAAVSQGRLHAGGRPINRRWGGCVGASATRVSFKAIAALRSCMHAHEIAESSTSV